MVFGFSTNERDASDEANFITVQPTSAEDGEELPSYEKPSFAAAREHFQKSLAHRVEDRTQPTGFKLAGVGVQIGADGQPAQLYDPMSSRVKEMDEFGIGVSLYFRTLRVLFAVLLVCALIALVSINENAKFNPDQSYIDNYIADNPGTTQDPEATPWYMIGSVYGTERDDLKLAKQAAADIAILCILTIFSICAGIVEGTAVEISDGNQLTAQDYSVAVRNPPKDVRDAKAYYDLFKKYGDVVFVSVVKNNGGLMQALANKKVKDAELASVRALREHQEAKGKPALTQDSLTMFQSVLQATLGLYRTVEKVEEEIKAISSQIEGLCQRDYVPWRVYITYNSEHAQRRCLNAMSMGKFQSMMQSQEKADAVFHGRTLSVARAHEPSDVAFEFSHYKLMEKIISWVISYSLCFSVLVISYFVINSLQGGLAVALFISALNAMLPFVVKTITQTFEIHMQRSAMQRSILFKLVVVRCINSGILIYLAASYDETFGLTHLESIQNILIVDAFATPLLRFLDIDGYFYRYGMGMFAVSQDELNSYWMGNEWTLAERYTDMLKTVFVGLFFSVPLPSGLFITCFAMLSQLVVDKFSLMRLWRRPPNMDSSLSVMARYFFGMTVWAHVSVSRIYFANWPYRGIWNTDSAPAQQCGFMFCFTDSYMTEQQKTIVQLYSLGCFISFIIILLWICIFYFGSQIRSFFQYVKPTEADEANTAYRALSNPECYVPVLHVTTLSEPVICCNVSNVPKKYLPIPKGYFDDESIDPQMFSVATTEELPFLNADSNEDVVVKSLFSEIFYANPPAAKKAEEHVPEHVPHVNKYAFSSAAASMSSDSGKPSSLSSTVGSTASLLPPVAINSGNDNVNPASMASMYAQRTGATFSSAQGKLPYGWAKKTTPAGKVYYVDHNTKTTHWALPGSKV